MSTSSIQQEDVFICPLCNVGNRAAAKYCRRCGLSRSVLGTYVEEHAANASAPAPLVKPSDAAHRQDSTYKQTSASTTMRNQLVESANSVEPANAPSSSQPESNQGSLESESAKGTAARSELTETRTVKASANQSGAHENSVRSAGNDKPTAREPAYNAASGPMPHSIPHPHGQGHSSSPECPSCYTAVRTTDRFCCWCGENQPSRPVPQMKNCPECTQRLPGRANYCFVCGRNVGGNARLRMRVPTELFREENSEFFPTFDA